MEKRFWSLAARRGSEESSRWRAPAQAQMLLYITVIPLTKPKPRARR